MDFISVLELVESVAKHVPIPEAWKDGVLKLEEIPVTPFIDRSGRAHVLESNHQIKVGMLNGLFLSAFRDSEAAAALDQYLHNAAAQGPRWFDWGETGRPKLSDAVRNEAMPMLVHMSRYFDRYVKIYQSGRFDSWPNANDIQSSEGKFKSTGDSRRLREIGFERTELIGFLAAHGIPHSLAGTSSIHDAPQATVGNLQLHPSSVAVDKKHQSEPGRTVRRAGVRRHVLADLIEAAQDAAADRRDAHGVWTILVNMAQSDNRPDLLDGFEPRKGVKYLAGDDYKYYTFDALRKYINPEARGRKTAPARNSQLVDGA